MARAVRMRSRLPNPRYWGRWIAVLAILCHNLVYLVHQPPDSVARAVGAPLLGIERAAAARHAEHGLQDCPIRPGKHGGGPRECLICLTLQQADAALPTVAPLTVPDAAGDARYAPPNPRSAGSEPYPASYPRAPPPAA